MHFARYSNLCLCVQGLGRHSVALNGEKIGTLVKIAFKPHGWRSSAITNQEEQNYPAHSWTDLFIRHHPRAIVQCHLIHALFIRVSTLALYKAAWKWHQTHARSSSFLHCHSSNRCNSRKKKQGFSSHWFELILRWKINSHITLLSWWHQE